MAGGPIFPFATYPINGGKTFPWLMNASGYYIEGLGVVSNLATASVVWQCYFAMPPTLPSGTGKLRLLALASAAAGSCSFNVTWRSAAVEEEPGGALVAEGVSSLAWSAGDTYVFKENKTVLSADTLAVSEIVVTALQFRVSGWDMSSITIWIPSIIWE